MGKIDWLHKLYDKQAINPRKSNESERMPYALSKETEFKLSGVGEHDTKHHTNYPRVKRTYQQTKPNGWASEWGIGKNTDYKQAVIGGRIRKLIADGKVTIRG